MTTPTRVHHGLAQALPEQMLEEIVLQLPLGLICSDLDGEILFMNAAAQELLAPTPPAGAYADRTPEEKLPALPAEIRKGIEYFIGLLGQPCRTYTRPFPKLHLQHQAGYDVEFFLYCPLDELTREARQQTRIIILLKSATLIMPAGGFGQGFSLTNRERQVLHHLIAGKARKEIAAEMHLSEDTVRSYLRSLYEKLGVSSRVEAATLGLRMVLLENLKSVLQIEK